MTSLQAIALAQSKPPGKSTRTYLEDIRIALLAASDASERSHTSTGDRHLDARLPSSSSRSSEPGPSTRPRPQPPESESRTSSIPSTDKHVNLLHDRIKSLEQRLERAEAEADQAKLALLSRPELPPTLSTTELDPTAAKKKNGKRKAGDAVLDSSEPANKKRKRKGAANANAADASESRSAIVSSKVSLEELLRHIEVGEHPAWSISCLMYSKLT